MTDIRRETAQKDFHSPYRAKEKQESSRSYAGRRREAITTNPPTMLSAPCQPAVVGQADARAEFAIYCLDLCDGAPVRGAPARGLPPRR